MLEAGDREFPVQVSTGSSTGDRPEEALQLLLRLFLGLRRGMVEFRRAYGLGEPESLLDSMNPEEVLGRLSTAEARGEVRIAIERGIEDLMIHQASLLEAYQAATQRGSRTILDSLDPETLRNQVEAGKVRIGPITLPARFSPVLMQAIWEEFLRRFAELRRLDPADFERFYRDGFRDGYREFRAARSPRDS
jgi:predicted component of type VI protein secretion system